MSKGKIAAQAGHAAVSAAEDARRHRKEWWKAWMKEGQCKIAVKVAGEKQLLNLEEQARQVVIPHALIIDKGLTEVPPETITCLGIGPAPAEMVDKITDTLPLL